MKLRLIFDILDFWHPSKCCRSFQTVSAGKRKVSLISLIIDARFWWLDLNFTSMNCRSKYHQQGFEQMFISFSFRTFVKYCDYWVLSFSTSISSCFLFIKVTFCLSTYFTAKAVVVFKNFFVSLFVFPGCFMSITVYIIRWYSFWTRKFNVTFLFKPLITEAVIK